MSIMFFLLFEKATVCALAWALLWVEFFNVSSYLPTKTLGKKAHKPLTKWECVVAQAEGSDYSKADKETAKQGWLQKIQEWLDSFLLAALPFTCHLKRETVKSVQQPWRRERCLKAHHGPQVMTLPRTLNLQWGDRRGAFLSTMTSSSNHSSPSHWLDVCDQWTPPPLS